MFILPGSMSREWVSIWMCSFWAAAEQNSSRTQWTASVMLYGTDLVNFILLLTTTLPFLKLRISSFLKPVRFACRYGSSCREAEKNITYIKLQRNGLSWGEQMVTLSPIASCYTQKPTLALLLNSLSHPTYKHEHTSHSEPELVERATKVTSK